MQILVVQTAVICEPSLWLLLIVVGMIANLLLLLI